MRHMPKKLARSHLPYYIGYGRLPAGVPERAGELVQIGRELAHPYGLFPALPLDMA